MTATAILLAAWGLSAARVETPPPPEGLLSASFDTCDTWISKPLTWADHISEFPKRSGLNERGLVDRDSIPVAAMPPPQWRFAMHHWSVRDPAGRAWITTSDILPVCHAVTEVAGSAAAVEDLLVSPNFLQKWEKRGEMSQLGVVTTEFRDRTRTTSQVVLVVSRRTKDHYGDKGPQVLISEQLELGK